MLGPEQHHHSVDGLSLPPRLYPEGIAILASRAIEAIADLGAGALAGHYWRDDADFPVSAAAEAAAALGSFSTTVIERCLEFKDRLQDPLSEESVQFRRELGRLCAWLVQQDVPEFRDVRERVGRAFHQGLIQSYGASRFIAGEFINAPRSEREFYLGAEWCLRHGEWLLKDHQTSECVQTAGSAAAGSERERALRIARHVALEPRGIVEALGADGGEGAISLGLSRELVRILSGGQNTDGRQFGRFARRVLRTFSPDKVVDDEVREICIAGLLRLGALDPGVARKFTQGLAQSVYRAKEPVWVGDKDLSQECVWLHAPTDNDAFWAGLGQLANRLKNAQGGQTQGELHERVINLSSRCFSGMESRPVISAAFENVFQLARSRGGSGMGALLGAAPSTRQQEKSNELVCEVDRLSDELRRQGLGELVKPLVYTPQVIMEIGRSGGFIADIVSHAQELPPARRASVLISALQLPYGRDFSSLLPANAAGLLIAASLPDHPWAAEASDFSAVSLLVDERGVEEVVSFLLTPASTSTERNYSWLGSHDTEFEVQSSLSDRSQFLLRYSELLRTTGAPLEELYSRLDASGPNGMTRRNWPVAQLLSRHDFRAAKDGLAAWADIVGHYRELGGEVYDHVRRHRALWCLEDYHAVDLRHEALIYAEFVRTFRGSRSPALFFFFRSACLTQMPEGSEGFEGSVREIGSKVRAECRHLGALLAGDRFSWDFLECLNRDVVTHVLGGADSDEDFVRNEIYFRGAVFSESRGAEELGIVTVPKSALPESALQMQEGVKRVVSDVELDMTCAMERLPKGLEQAIKEEARGLSRLLREKVQSLPLGEGPGRKFAEQTRSEAQKLMDQLRGLESPDEYLRVCEKVAQSKQMGKAVRAYAQRGARRIGIQMHLPDVSAQALSWRERDYSDEEKLVGCVELLRGLLELSRRSDGVSPHGVWENAFGVKPLEAEAFRVLRCVKESSAGDERIDLRIRIRWSSSVLESFAGLICDSCIRGAAAAEDSDNRQFFTFSWEQDGLPRLGGGTFLLDAVTEAGDKVCIVRGFNPNYALSKEVDLGSLFEAFVDTLAVALNGSNVKAIVVPRDLHSGLSQTNRLAVHSHLREHYYNRSETVRLREELSFNGLLMHECVVVRRLNQSSEERGSVVVGAEKQPAVFEDKDVTRLFPHPRSDSVMSRRLSGILFSNPDFQSRSFLNSHLSSVEMFSFRILDSLSKFQDPLHMSSRVVHRSFDEHLRTIQTALKAAPREMDELLSWDREMVKFSAQQLDALETAAAKGDRSRTMDLLFKLLVVTELRAVKSAMDQSRFSDEGCYRPNRGLDSVWIDKCDESGRTYQEIFDRSRNHPWWDILDKVRAEVMAAQQAPKEDDRREVDDAGSDNTARIRFDLKASQVHERLNALDFSAVLRRLTLEDSEDA